MLFVIFIPKRGNILRKPSIYKYKDNIMGTKTENFIKKCVEKYGDNFDYSRVVYTGSHEKVEIGCKKHGFFKISATNFLQRGTCPICGKEPDSEKIFNEFITKAKSLYGEKYSYENIQYKNCKDKVLITCKEHGDFLVSPDKFIQGQECPLCVKEKKRKKVENNFILKLTKIFGDHFDLSKLYYVNKNTPVALICKEHGEFLIKPSCILDTKYCPLCRKSEKEQKENYIKLFKQESTKEKKDKIVQEFLTRAKEIHQGKYDYSKVNYISALKKVCIICPEHGEFWQTPNNHLKGKGCPKCCGKNKTTEEFIIDARKIHGDAYDYTKTVYEQANRKVCIICPEHGEFWQTPNKHLEGHGCPKCHQSHLEREVSIKLTERGIKYQQFARPSFLKKKEYDFYLPEYHIAIECQGLQHFNKHGWYNCPQDRPNETIRRDIEKYSDSINNGVSLYYMLPQKIKIDDLKKDKRLCGIYNKNNTFYSIDDFINNKLCRKQK